MTEIDELSGHLSHAVLVATCRNQNKVLYSSLTTVNAVSKLDSKITDFVFREFLKRRRGTTENIEGSVVSDAISGTQLNYSFCQKHYMTFRKILSRNWKIHVAVYGGGKFKQNRYNLYHLQKLFLPLKKWF